MLAHSSVLIYCICNYNRLVSRHIVARIRSAGMAAVCVRSGLNSSQAGILSIHNINELVSRSVSLSGQCLNWSRKGSLARRRPTLCTSRHNNFYTHIAHHSLTTLRPHSLLASSFNGGILCLLPNEGVLDLPALSKAEIEKSVAHLVAEPLTSENLAEYTPPSARVFGSSGAAQGA